MSRVNAERGKKVKRHHVESNTASAVLGLGAQKRVGFILHTTEGRNSLAWLQGDSAKAGRPASADRLITRNGEVYYITPHGKWAFHAGQSSVHGMPNMGGAIGASYIGIELENFSELGEDVTELQYQACAQVMLEDSYEHKMSPIQCYGHGNIALPFGRRSDPVRFDYGKLFYYMAHPTPFMGA
jgi:N-acetylmuramoyl-L-alanine amidase